MMNGELRSRAGACGPKPGRMRPPGSAPRRRPAGASASHGRAAARRSARWPDARFRRRRSPRLGRPGRR